MDKNSSLRKLKPIIAVVTFILLVVVITVALASSSLNKKISFSVSEKIFSIDSGETLKDISQRLKIDGIINSQFWFVLYMSFTNSERKIKTGQYLFESGVTSKEVARKLTEADYGFRIMKVTLPEGLTVSQIAETIKNKLSGFDSVKFLELASDKEGFLFPDTYTLPENISPNEVIGVFEKNFSRKISTIQNEVDASGKSLKDIIIMASILEEEGKDSDSRKTISGILWKRLSLSMPLQVDAALTYVTGKSTYDLTTSDLKFASAYNTYIHTGLTPTPISNPGMDSISSALNPTKTKYFYYLSERDGTMHYSVTYAEHLRNKALYIK